MKKLLVASSLAVALASGAFAGESKPSFDLYAGGGTNQNFVIGGDVELLNDQFISTSFKKLNGNWAYKASINTLFLNEQSIGSLGGGFMISDFDSLTLKPILTGNYVFENYQINGYFADSHSYGASFMKNFWSKRIEDHKVMTITGGVNFDKIQGDSENSIFLRVNYLFGGN